MTRVVNIRREVCDVYIGRAGRGHDGYFGNPFKDGSRLANIERFRIYFAARISKDDEFRQRVLSLKGKKLGCFCSPLPCHGDVYVTWLEAQP